VGLRTPVSNFTGISVNPPIPRAVKYSGWVVGANVKMPTRKIVRPKMAAPRRNRTNIGRISGTQQSVRVNYRELWSQVTGAGTSSASSPPYLAFNPGFSGLAQLDALGSLYESYRLVGPVKVQYKASASMVTSGSFVMGVDYDARDTVVGYNGVVALNPKAIGSVFKDHQVVVTPDRAMNKKWLFCNGQAAGEAAFALGYTCTASGTGAVGDIWCEYSIEFISPRIPSATLSDMTTLLDVDGVTYYNQIDRALDSPFVEATRNTAGISTTTSFDTNFVVGATSPSFLPGTYRIVLNNAAGSGTARYNVNQPGIQLISINESSNGTFDAFVRLAGTFFAGAIIMNMSRGKISTRGVSLSLVVARALYGPKLN